MHSSADPIVLEMFVTAKDCGSYERAATLLRRSPSDIRQAIDELEQSLGNQLFAHSLTPLHLSLEGQMLYLHALDVLDSWYLSQNIIRQLQQTSLAS